MGDAAGKLGRPVERSPATACHDVVGAEAVVARGAAHQVIIDVVAALPDVIVPDEHDVDAVALEQRAPGVAHGQVAAEGRAAAGAGVGRMVQERELPGRRAVREVVLQPGGLRCVDAAGLGSGVEDDEVHLPGVERVVALRLRRVSR